MCQLLLSEVEDADQWPHLSEIYLPEIDSKEVRLITPFGF